MKVICDRGALLDAINLVSGVVAARTPRPQLQCVKLSAKKTGKASELTLSATDAEISLRLQTAQVDVQEPGDVGMHVGGRLLQAVADAGLGREVDHRPRPGVREQSQDGFAVGQV